MGYVTFISRDNGTSNGKQHEDVRGKGMWSKRMKKVKCPDGPRFIHRNPNDAFPLYVRDWSTEMNAAMGDLDHVKGSLGAKYETQISGFLFYLDKANSGMQMEFAAIYLVYCTNPCNKDQYLEDGVKKVIDHVHELMNAHSVIERVKTEISKGKTEQERKHLLTEAVATVAKALSTSAREKATTSDEFKKVTANALAWLEGS